MTTAFRAATALGSILLLFVLAEVALRFTSFAPEDTDGRVVGQITLDDRLGWRPTANYQRHADLVDASGEAYTVSAESDAAGFRLFGDPESEKTKVLFIGDSYTQAIEVSNDKTYYALLNDALPLETFAIGSGGYGTLQELLLLEEILSRVDPDVVVLQLCSNDFINNHLDLEVRSRYNNNGLRRPYWTLDGRLIYATPKRFPRLREWASKRSRFGYFLFSRYDIVRADRLATRSDPSIEDTITSQGLSSVPQFGIAAAITEQLLNRIVDTASVPVYAFMADSIAPFHDELRRIALAAGIDFIDGVPGALAAAVTQGIEIRSKDKAHWNEAGHQIVAKVLIERLAGVTE